MPTKTSEVVVVEDEQEVMGLSKSNSNSLGGSSSGSSVETTETVLAAADGGEAVIAVCPMAPVDMQQSQPQPSNGAAIKYRVCHLRRPIAMATVTANGSASVTPQTPPAPQPSNHSYGFDLHAERDRIGHFIGHVTAGSLAEAAGLRENDRIIEVNGFNVEMETHKQVVNRIRLNSHEVKLLVVDGGNPNAMQVSQSHSDSNNNNIQTPASGKFDFDGSVDGIYDPNNRAKAAFLAAPTNLNNNSIGNITNNNNNNNNHATARLKTENLYPALNLNITASEFRAKLAARKKYDPKKEPINFRRKYEIIQDL